MPIFTIKDIDNLEKNGPILNIILSPSQFRLNRLSEIEDEDDDGIEKSSKVTQEIKAMIDTGASRSVMSNGLRFIKYLEPSSTTYISTPSSSYEKCYEYPVIVKFPEIALQGTKDFEIATNIIGVPNLESDIKCLIGRDILKYSIMVYDGVDNRITLSF